MYQLHIANKNYSSWSLRPWVLMTELGIAFEECMHTFKGNDNHAEFIAFNPTGLVPCLVAGDETVWDSLAIIEFLAEQHEGVWANDVSARTWSRCAAAEMHSGFSAVRNLCPMNCGLRITLASIPKELQADIDRINTLWCHGLEQFGGPFLAGETFSAIDAFFAPVVFRFQSYHIHMSPEALAYIQRILALRSMESWYNSALTEPYKDEAHEAQSLASGNVIGDFRV